MSTISQIMFQQALTRTVKAIDQTKKVSGNMRTIKEIRKSI